MILNRVPMCVSEYSKRVSFAPEGEPDNVSDSNNTKDMNMLAIAFTSSEGSTRFGKRNLTTHD